jgi:hypothetical protein
MNISKFIKRLRGMNPPTQYDVIDAIVRSHFNDPGVPENIEIMLNNIWESVSPNDFRFQLSDDSYVNARMKLFTNVKRYYVNFYEMKPESSHNIYPDCACIAKNIDVINKELTNILVNVVPIEYKIHEDQKAKMIAEKEQENRCLTKLWEHYKR